MEECGFQIAGYNSAKDALAALRPGKFDLLLTDLMMPEMNGPAFLGRALEMDPNLAGIVMTSHAGLEAAVEAMKAGALDVILKPFKVGAVAPVLQRALAVRRLRLENHELQARVLERTAELEAANHELESFTFSVSHDLRAPLRGIDGFSQMILRDYGGQMPEEARLLLGKVKAQTEWMQHLVEDLMRLSRLGRQHLSRRHVNMPQLVNDALEQLQHDREGRHAEIRVGELADAMGDRGLLGQVWLNLLSNALKFTRKREDAVVEAGCEHGPEEIIYFVRDNGAGFDMEYAARLFGVFQRLHSSEEFEGTGIGLSIVQRIVQRHGGRTWAEGRVGVGATFYFSLPVEPEGLQSQDSAVENAARSRPDLDCRLHDAGPEDVQIASKKRWGEHTHDE